MVFPKSWGEYPPEYNREIHGPYDPAVNYGKRDTPFSEVKLGELGAWFGRRNKSATAAFQALGRFWWRYQHKWVHPKKPGPAHLYHFFFWTSLFGFYLNRNELKNERYYRYH